MAALIFQLLKTLIIFTFCTSAFGSTLRLKAVPSIFSEVMTRQLNINCDVVGSSETEGRSIYNLRLEKQGQQPIALYSKNELTKGPNMKKNMKADGHLNNAGSLGYLRLSISDPLASDAGTYTCVMVYMDKTFETKTEKSDVVVEVDNNNLAATLDILTKKVRAQEDETTKLRAIVTRQQERIKDLTDRETYTIAFSAGYAQNRPDALSGNTMVFTEPILDIGNAYNFKTGLFKAPKKGLYVFYLTVANFFSGSYISVDLRNHDKVVSSLQVGNSGYFDQSTVSCVVTMEENDVIKAQFRSVHNDGHLQYGDHFTTLTGFLLKQL